MGETDIAVCGGRRAGRKGTRIDAEGDGQEWRHTAGENEEEDEEGGQGMNRRRMKARTCNGEEGDYDEYARSADDEETNGGRS